jgi:hypothetical protein
MNESVTLGDRRRSRLPGGDHVGAPRADAARCDLTQLGLAEDREDVQTQLTVVQLASAGPQRPLGEPARRVLLERHLARVGVDPRPSVDICTIRREVRVGLALGVIGHGRVVPHEIDAVARLESTRR